MAIKVDPKDPNEILDYIVDWTARLSDDTIDDSDFTVDPASGDINIDAQEVVDSTHTKVWLSGGTLGETVLVTNRIETAGGRTMDQTIKLKIKAK